MAQGQALQSCHCLGQCLWQCLQGGWCQAGRMIPAGALLALLLSGQLLLQQSCWCLGGLWCMQRLLLEMEEEKSMRDVAVIVQPCSQWAFPARVRAGGAAGIVWLSLWSSSLSPVSDVVQVGLCCHCKTWLNFPELQTHPASCSSPQESFYGYFLHLQSLPPLIPVSGSALGCCSLPCACAEQAPVKHIPRVSQLGSKPSQTGLCGAWSSAGAARNHSLGNEIIEEQLCALTELTGQPSRAGC